MLARTLERTLANIRRRPLRHAATALCLSVAFLTFGAFAVGFWTLSDGVERWGGEYEVTVYVADDALAGTGPLRAMLGAQPEVSRVTHVGPREAKRRLAGTFPAGAGLDDLPTEAFPASFELRLKPGSRTPETVAALADRLRTAPGVDSVETYGPWLKRLSSLVGWTRAAAIGVGLLVLCVAFVVVGFAARLARAERRSETELLRIVGATPGYIELPLALEGALQGLLGAGSAAILLAAGLAILRRAGQVTLSAPPAWAAVLFALAGAVVGALAARRTAVSVR